MIPALTQQELLAAAPEMRKAIHQMVQAIEGGEIGEDRRGTVYRQEFGSAFVAYLRKVAVLKE